MAVDRAPQIVFWSDITPQPDSALVLLAALVLFAIWMVGYFLVVDHVYRTTPHETPMASVAYGLTLPIVVVGAYAFGWWMMPEFTLHISADGLWSWEMR